MSTAIKIMMLADPHSKRVEFRGGIQVQRLRVLVVAATLLVALIAGSGVASAGVEWCDWGSPPPMDVGIAPLPGPKESGLPTPEFKNANGKFGVNPVVEGQTVPPGMAKAAPNE